MSVFLIVLFIILQIYQQIEKYKEKFTIIEKKKILSFDEFIIYYNENKNDIFIFKQRKNKRWKRRKY